MRSFFSSALMGLFLLSLPVLAETVKTTKTGQKFTRDTSRPKLGEAWRDPSEMIWGDLVKREDGTPRLMNYEEATEYCASIDAELPSRADFNRLIASMGGKSYTPQVLPNLTFTKNGEAYNRSFWSSSAVSYMAYIFTGLYGQVYLTNRYEDSLISVRCVYP